MQPPIPDTFDKVLGGISPGYQCSFKQAAQHLVQEGIIGPNNPQATRVVEKMLDEAAQDRRLEHVLSKLFQSLTPGNRWLFRYPTLLQSWSELAVAMGREKTYMGIRYVELWAEGRIGETPIEMGLALRRARDLLNTDAGLSLNFLIGYAKLARHLDINGIDGFIAKALHRYAYQPEQSYAFLQVRTKAAEAHIDRLSHRSGVTAHKQRLTVLVQSITGASFRIEERPEMPVDAGMPVIQPPLVHADTVYLPAQFKQFDSRSHNFEHMQFAVVVCAAAYVHQSFCRVHGQRGMASSRSLFEGRLAANATTLNNLFICKEIYRVLTRIIATFRGLGTILRRVLRYEKGRWRTNNHELLFNILVHFSRPDDTQRIGLEEMQIGDHEGRRQLIELVREVASASESYRDVVKGITTSKAQAMATRFKEILGTPAPLSFFPDYNHLLASGAGSGPLPTQDSGSQREPESRLPANHDTHENRDPVGGNSDDGGGGTEAIGGNKRRVERKTNTGANGAGHRFYYYDEWNQANADYYPNWVRLKEIVPERVVLPVAIAGNQLRYVQKLKQAFEQLKPDLMRKQKFLLEGDEIDTDLLIEHLCSRKAGHITDENYYQKPYVKRRDLAVALLLDLSGSTGNQLDNGCQVIDMEKEAAFILGEGLAELGDRFGIFGFTGQGRLDAEYYRFKDFDDSWCEKTKGALFNAVTGSTTRMGVAIRHTGQKLAKLDAHKKLVLVITDGKPMDAEYSPYDGYAQFDVAKAVGELKHQAIDVFCISTEENKVKDLEIMFPFQRFAIIKSMADLPKLLTRFYLKLTT